MPVELRYNRDKKPRNFWYGRLIQDGKHKVFNLGVQVKGTPPASLKDVGDTAFEASRTKAEAALEVARREAQEKGSAEHLTRRLIETKTGRAVENVKLGELAERWRKAPKARKASKNWLAWSDTVLNRFAEALGKERFLYDVTEAEAAEYVEGLQNDYARKTARAAAQMLRSAFARLLPLGTSNPFARVSVVSAENGHGAMIHREPFTAKELASLFEVSRADPLLHPLIVTGACTGLRRGDICRLRWESVNLGQGELHLMTAKTGRAVCIPIFEPLRVVLERALAEKEEGAGFVYPEAAKLYKANPDGLTYRFKKLVVEMYGEEPDEALLASETSDSKSVERGDLGKHLKAIEKGVAGQFEGIRAARIVETVQLYAEGLSVRDIEKKQSRARSGISADLRAAESAAGLSFMPQAGIRGRAATGGVKAAIARVTRKQATGRCRAASVKDWHALRTTFVTVALAAGVPIEVCKAVTGHTLTETVLRHYFKPQAAELRAVLGAHLPSVLTGSAPAAAALVGGDIAALAEHLKTLSKTERKQLAALLK